jgi:hypothetical protein
MKIGASSFLFISLTSNASISVIQAHVYGDISGFHSSLQFEKGTFYN